MSTTGGRDMTPPEPRHFEVQAKRSPLDEGIGVTLQIAFDRATGARAFYSLVLWPNEAMQVATAIGTVLAGLDYAGSKTSE